MSAKSDAMKAVNLVTRGEYRRLISGISNRVRRHTIDIYHNRRELARLADVPTDPARAMHGALEMTVDSTFGYHLTKQIEEVQRRRSGLEDDESEITYTYFGPKDEGVDADATTDTERICDLPMCSRRYGELLTALTRNFAPDRALELGSCLGISAGYIGSGLGENGRLVTIEAAEPQYNVARETIEELGLTDRVEVRNALFQDVLFDDDFEPVDMAFLDGHHNEDATIEYFDALCEIATDNALIVFDDVFGYSEGMTRAWETIRADERVSLAVSTRRYGLAVVNSPEQSCAHFDVRI